MSPKLMQQYDVFLDENDWDIYYWATQEPPPTSLETAEGASSTLATPAARGKDAAGNRVSKQDDGPRQPASGEWAQTVGTFKPAYRPVPSRWRGSEILGALRRHVQERKAGGVIEADADVEAGKRASQLAETLQGKGLGMMPPIRNLDQ